MPPHGRERPSTGPHGRGQLAYAIDNGDATGQLRAQYFEVMGSRAIYHDGWMGPAIGPRRPWLPGLPQGTQDWTPDNDTWEV